MFHGFAIFRRKRQASACYELPVILQMHGWSEGDTVSTSTVVMVLLWQYYGLVLYHPEVSRWLEQNAPDVKYAVAEGQLASGDNRTRCRIGPNGMMTVYLSLEVDDRLREVSSRYILRQSAHFDQWAAGGALSGHTTTSLLFDGRGASDGGEIRVRLTVRVALCSFPSRGC
jgi:hypothetical protein